MASNREERQQMRQRGAALRKTKAIDFGFSFGLPSASDESQSASRPADVGISLGPPAPSTTTTATTEPETTQPSIASPERKLSSSQDGPIRRTPGSARNKLPPRPSPFDIPTEEPPEVGPSRKIRKLDHPRRTSTISLGARDEGSSQPHQNGVVPSATAQLPEEPTVTPVLNGGATGKEQPQVPSTTPVVPENPVPVQASEPAEPLVPDATTTPPEIQPEPQAKATPSPGQRARGKRKRRTSRDSETSSCGSPQDAVSPKVPEVDDEQLSEPMDISPDGKSDAAGSPTSAARDSTERQDGTVLQDVTGSTPSEIQVTSDVQITSEEQATAAQEISTQPQVASEPEITEPQMASEPEVAIDLQEAEPQAVTEEPATEPQEAAESQDVIEPQETTEPKQAAAPHSRRAQTKSPTPPRAKRTRGQRAASAQPPSTAKQSRVARAGSVESAPAQVRESKRLRRGIGKGQEPTPDIPTIEEEPGVEPGEADVPSEPRDDIASRKGTRQSRLPRPTLARKNSTRAGRPGRKPTRSRDTQKETSQPEKEVQQQEEQAQPEPEPEPESVLKPESVPAPVPEPEAEAEAEEEAEAELEPEPIPEPETEPQPEPPAEPGPSRPTKRGRGRQPLAKKKDDTTQAPIEEPTVQAEPTEEVQPKKGKPRQPRGETVPVTVHRFANAAALGDAPELEGSSDEEEPADEAATKQKAKLVSRGGVNAADVLSQICRETLEKTLTTLKNGIANEGNAARRAEWTRKKKAVEAYGTELEGRLFELSEMLDSNFALGRQVKKSKREMMDLRSRLYQVRKEREAVALQMDAVRRKHTEEENAKIARSTINNSLHSLDLALERSRNRPIDESTSKTPDSSTVGLEFLLRNVAENVSSVAPGAQGGLLHQIRSFNAQLEATARRLES
ncbi:hypothetical protein BO94DRAFT_522318 [Aspergillus sclerotioniger CBS 115572]|uniref:Inner kinetochore subunit AME1 domain-containing protein n=1 Tax=Aspergillus sclerotioniger CBS 115572 TaxID=1450535 RepID=A0A317VZV8_9EURO|nr:hypothetical protein BO94DRAFT_522318 [Aspergillus sclerotioniger CBS 115572]PWY78542.1 hypothetical protein BO94DRAFT_522318 [Aspergillus sclerotioniger CBS 115572]